MYCGEPTLLKTMSTTVTSSAPRTSSSAPTRGLRHSRAPSRWRRHHRNPTAAASAKKNSPPIASAAACVPGPTSSYVTSVSLNVMATAPDHWLATSHGVAPTASTCRPRRSCSVRNEAMCGNPPSAVTSAMTARLTATAGATTSRHGRRAARNRGASSAPGATLVHAATVSRADESHGWRRPSTSATTTTGATTASRRPMPTGPSSARKPTHHHAPSVVECRDVRRPAHAEVCSSANNAIASSTMTPTDQATAKPEPSVDPPAAATSIGSSAPGG